MKQLLIKFGMVILLGFVSLTGVASIADVGSSLGNPSFFEVHNQTNFQAKAYLSGKESPIVQPLTVTRVPWFLIRLACLSEFPNKRLCEAEIQVATDSSSTPKFLSLGLVSLDIDSGEIFPKEISVDRYTLSVKAPGKFILSQR